MCMTSTQFAVYAHFLILMMGRNKKRANKLIDGNSIEKKTSMAYVEVSCGWNFAQI